jgi:ATP-dependent Lhr-like helicase
MDPRRKSATTEQPKATSLRKRAAARTTAGRWSLLCEEPREAVALPKDLNRASAETQEQAIAAARRNEAALDAHARILLGRYGVLFRDLLTRESNAPKWRDLVPVLRRLEARGEIRGGRFVSGPFGEQYAVPEAADSLRKARKLYVEKTEEAAIAIAAADPLNLVGIIVPGERVAAMPGNQVSFVNGCAVQDDAAPVLVKRSTRARAIADLLRNEGMTSRPVAAPATLGLFQ